VTRERTARGFDLTRGNAVRLHGLEAELTERQILAAGRKAFDPALVRLAEFGA
jgi:hypothetical protein